MRLYSQVDLTGNVNMIEKLNLGLGGTGTGESYPQPDTLTPAPAPSRQTIAYIDKTGWQNMAVICIRPKNIICVFLVTSL